MPNTCFTAEIAETIVDMLRPLSQEEREAVVRFVGDAVCLFLTRRKDGTS